jgi:hypothetical protein
LLSSVAFAQQHSAPAPPPPPPPPPAAAPVSAPSPAPSFTPSVPSPTPESHVSAPASSPAPATSAAPAAHVSEPSVPSPAPTPPAARSPEPDRVVTDQKIAGEEKIEGAPRIGEDSHTDADTKGTPEKEKDEKAEPDLRRHICGDKPCQSPEPKPVEPDKVKRRPCLKEPCTCPPGERASGGACVSTVVENNGCRSGEFWNGASCIARSCPPNETWDGARCTPLADECVAIEGAAARLVAQLRPLKAEMERVCAQDPSGQECLYLQQQHERLLAQYWALWNQASPICRSRLPNPDTL